MTAVVWLSHCQTSTEQQKNPNRETESTESAKPRKRPVSVENGKFFDKDGRKYLWGGEDSSWHFDITDYILKDEQFHYGIGRERFHALIDPQFISREIADTIYADSARFLVAKIGNEVKAYSIKLLTHHEVVNDIIGGQPIMAAYCILADLGAIYDRTIGDKTYTFALSGYTYYDPQVWDGMDGFVLWDRDTESLWWPLIGKSISGLMQETPMQVHDEQHWAQTSWKEIKEKYPEVLVLTQDQTMEPPQNWPKYQDSPDLKKSLEKSIAPRWGENDQLNEDRG